MRDTIIAGTKKCGDWLSVRDSLASSNDPAVWRAAFDDYFQARIHLRYLRPIELLQDYDSKQGEGFSMVAIDCSLVEFLESAVQGKTYRWCQSDAELLKYEYRKSAPVFVSFLTTREPFRDTFDSALANEFYSHIRCGLLHEARTKAGWRIHARGPGIVDRAQRILYRDNFHDALLQFLRWYREALATTPELQEAFIRKVNALCGEGGAA